MCIFQFTHLFMTFFLQLMVLRVYIYSKNVSLHRHGCLLGMMLLANDPNVAKKKKKPFPVHHIATGRKHQHQRRLDQRNVILLAHVVFML